MFDEDGLMKVSPIGPWKVLEDDEDGTYELFDIGMARAYMGLAMCNVWVWCDTKLKVGKIYHGKLITDTSKNFPVLILNS